MPDAEALARDLTELARIRTELRSHEEQLKRVCTALFARQSLCGLLSVQVSSDTRTTAEVSKEYQALQAQR